MTKLEEALVRALYTIQLQQPIDSEYWKDNGGTYLHKLAVIAGLSESEAETTAVGLKKNGYIELLVRDSKVSYPGVRLLQKAIDEIQALDILKKQSDEAAAVIAGQARFDSQVDKIIQNAKIRGLI